MPGKLFDSPLQGTFLRDIDSGACGCIENRSLYIFRNRHENIYVVSYTFLFVIAFNLNNEANSIVSWCLYDNVDQKEWFNANIKTVTH